MKLSFFIYQIRSRMIGFWAFMRYVGRGGINPFSASGRQMYSYAAMRFLLRQADQVEVPGTGQKKPAAPGEGNSAPRQGGSFLERQLSGFRGIEQIKSRFLGGSQGDDSQNAGNRILQKPQADGSVQSASSKIALENVEQYSDELLEEEEKLPLLTNRRHIQGRRGRYRVTHYLGRRGLGRLYEGININDNKPAIIKEYLLPGHIFNRLEIQQRKQEFERLAGVNLIERTQDFRLIGAFEAIADDQENRCYLVTRGTENCNSTLRELLQQQGAMGARGVHEVIRQVLQTLEYLHAHKFRLGNAQVQRGLLHKNICLDSLLYDAERLHSSGEQQFFVYLTDLGIWEHLFRDPRLAKAQISPPEYQPKIDLSDLGKLGFHLLVGRDREAGTEQILDPRNKSLWPVTDEPLKQFILQLLGLNGTFNTVEEARLALPPVPSEEAIAPAESTKDEKGATRKRWKKALWITGGVVSAGLLGGAIWWGVSQWKNQQETEQKRALLAQSPCCIQKLDFPKGKFTYSSEKDGIWHYILRHPGLVSLGKTLEKELAQRAPGFKLNYQPEDSLEPSLIKLRDSKLDFVVTTLPANSPSRSALNVEFEVQAIAYDGLAVFVPFSDVHRDRNLARSLKGNISFDQLRRLYTGKIKNWEELGGPDMEVKLYMPTDMKLVKIFEENVFAGHEDQLQRFIRTQKRGSIIQKDATQTLRDVLNDFEVQEVGSIGFDSLSKVFGQCSVYPLGISGDRPEGVQALMQDNGKPITPRSDLCDDKGSYWLSSDAFTQSQSYPLRYDLVVLYKKGSNEANPGRKFTDLWKTIEGQELLSEAGLVPLLPLERGKSK